MGVQRLPAAERLLQISPALKSFSLNQNLLLQSENF